MEITKYDPRFPIKVDNDFDKLYIALKIYITINEIIRTRELSNEVSSREALKKVRLPNEERTLKVLTYYALKGFTKETVKDCCRELGLTSQTNTQMICYLTGKEYLVKDKHNYSMRHLSPDLQRYCERVMSSDNKSLVIEFKQ